MKKKALALLKTLTEAPGVPASEDAVRNIFCDELGGDLSCDKVGSVIHCIEGTAADPRVMICAHMDEVGFTVQTITSNGFLKFAPLGGWWGHTLLSQRVTVHTRSGKAIMGIITSTPVHFLGESERKNVLPIDKMFIDVGAESREDVEKNFGIQLGDPIVPKSTFDHLHNPDLLVSKAFDDRAGLAATIQAAQQLAKRKHPNTCFAVGSCQEEVGTRGIQTAAAKVKPDVALILEGAPADDTPGNNSTESQGVLGKGVQIRLLDPTAIMNRGLVDFVLGVAKKCNIPHQLAVRTSGGTDAKQVHLHDTGVPTIVLGVPSRYIHSHNSIIDINDYLSALKLVTEVVNRLDEKTVASFTDYLPKKGRK